MMHARKKYFDYLEKKGKLPKHPMEDDEREMMAFGGEIEAPEHGDEFEHVPDDHEMPEHFSDGGMVGMSYDYQMGHADEFDSSGEPHTEDEKEDEHPMEFMSKGGRARRMAHGGMMHSPAFVKALRKARY